MMTSLQRVMRVSMVWRHISVKRGMEVRGVCMGVGEGGRCKIQRRSGRALLI